MWSLRGAAGPTAEPWSPDSWDSLPQTVKGHLQFHRRTAAFDNAMARNLELSSLVVSAAVPVAAAFGAATGVLAALGALATVLVSVNTRGRYRENWLRHNQLVLAIQHELVLYDHHRRPYDGPDGDRRGVLAITVDELVQTEAAGWADQERKGLPRNRTPDR